MKKRSLVLAALAVAVVLAAVPFVYAQGMHRHGRGDAGGAGLQFLFPGRLERARQALSLTDAQVVQLKAIAENLRTQNAPYREELRGGMQAVAQTLLANPNDIAGAQALLDHEAATRKAMQTNVLTAASKAITVLTAEQRAKVAEFVAARSSRARNR